MITYNFYKFQLIRDIRENFFNFYPKTNISGVIETLKKEFKEVNFIKFYIGGWEDVVFLADRDLGNYIKLNIISTFKDKRPEYQIGSLIQIKKMYPSQVSNCFKHPKYSYYYESGRSFYDFGPNPKILRKEFTISALGSIAELLIKE
jgi:hypothetical protein